MEQPKISIIVPVYKVEPYLRKCVDSIVNQTYTNLEIILVDDGSPDACGTICDEYAAKDDRIKVIHKENGGLSSARNAGLNVATGDYVGFVDSDDYIESNMYETLFRHIQKAGADLCICNCYEEDQKGMRLPIGTNLPPLEEILSPAEVFHRVVGYSGGVYAGVWNKLYQKRLFQNCRFVEGRIHEDEFIFHRIVGESTLIATVPIPLYHYYVHREGSICQVEYSSKNLDRVLALYDRYEYFKAHGYKYEARKSWQAAYGFLVTGLQKLPLKENRAVFVPLIKKIAFQSYVDLRTVKIMLIVIKKWLQETF